MIRSSKKLFAFLSTRPTGLSTTPYTATRLATRSATYATLSVVLFSIPGPLSIPLQADELNLWLQNQTTHSTQILLGNIGPSVAIPNAAPGAVAASPSHDPDYRAFWVRDGALTMDAVLGLYERSQNTGDRTHYLKLLLEYADFSRRLQLTSNPSGAADDLGLGEPKFNIDGSAYDSPWGRPQNDGPALRALTLIRLARDLIAQGQREIVLQRLYAPTLPAHAVIKADLEFVSHHWRDASFDLWEESQGDHFYTRIVQHRALREGAALAEQLGDGAAAAWYRSEARSLEPAIARHWDASRGYLTVTLNRVAGLDYKSSGLDSAIILGVLHAQPRGGDVDGFFMVTDDRILATAVRLSEAFRSIYSINSIETDRDHHPMQPGIGRYPEDRYSGMSTSEQGNPWFLITDAFAEFDYRCAQAWETAGRISVTSLNAPFFAQLKSPASVKAGESIPASDPRFKILLQGMREQGDGYLRRSQYHADSSGALSEQFNRDTGYMQSAGELTWSHASILTAAWARESGS